MKKSKGALVLSCSSWNDEPTKPEAGEAVDGPSCGNSDLHTERKRGFFISSHVLKPYFIISGSNAC